MTASVNSAVVHCTLQGFIARLVVRADKGRRAVWTYQVHGGYNVTHDDAPRGRLCYACLLHLTISMMISVVPGGTGSVPLARAGRANPCGLGLWARV